MNEQKKSSRKSILILVFSMVLLCALVGINVLIYYIPAEYTQFDATGIKMHKISKDSEELAASLQENVTIYWVLEDTMITDSNSMSYFLLKYLNAGDRIRLKLLDRTDDAEVIKKFTKSQLSDGSLIVESARRYQIIDSESMYYYVNEFINSEAGGVYKMTATQYENFLTLYGNDMKQTTTTRYFCGEALLSSALDYVTREQIPQTYVLEGHGGSGMSEILTEFLSGSGEGLKELALDKVDTVPVDAACVILFSPESDLNERETQLLTDYIQKGGSFLLVSGPDTSDFQNLASVCALFGMGPTGGKVVDPTAGYHVGTADLLRPLLIDKNHTITSYMNYYGFKAYMPESMGIAIADKQFLPKGVTTTVLLGTTTNGYRVSEDAAQTKLCDPAAQYVAACATMATTTADGTNNNAFFAWFASSQAFTDEAASAVSLGNYYYLATALNWMTMEDSFSSKYETIAEVDLSVPVLDKMTTTSAIVIGLATVVIVPLGLLTAGLVIWLKRRSR